MVTPGSLERRRIEPRVPHDAGARIHVDHADSKIGSEAGKRLSHKSLDFLRRPCLTDAPRCSHRGGCSPPVDKHN